MSDHPCDKPGREIVAQCAPEMAKRRRQELTAGEDGARDTSPVPRQLQDKAVHLYPLPAPGAKQLLTAGHSQTNTQHMDLPERVVDLRRRRRKVRAPAQTTGDSSSKPHRSVGTSLDFRDLRFRAIVCLLPICKQREHAVLTHQAALGMMKALGVQVKL